MKRKTGLAVALLISLMPFSALRCSLYRLVFGYTIRKSSIGLGTVIHTSRAVLDHCTIGRFNRFLGPMSVSIGAGSTIESHNVFDCGDWAADDNHAARYARTLLIGSDTLITNHHFFDVAGSLSIGDGTWIAGRGSQFWTHGVNVEDRNVSIGSQCYIGSAVRFAPGSSVDDNVIVGIGSVVVRSIAASGALIAGFPAIVIRENHGWKRTGPEPPQPGINE
jgi:acetyltransferase-like isoleucine patch superfamily enzyme